MDGADFAYGPEKDGEFAFDSAPILIAGDSEAALRRATETVSAAGLRIGGQVGTGQAAERIDQQARLGALWIELEQDGDAAVELLLDRINRDSIACRYPAI